jgi:hypothetical protein
MQYKKFLDCLDLKDGADRQSRNVCNSHSTLRNIPEERILFFSTFIQAYFELTSLMLKQIE